MEQKKEASSQRRSPAAPGFAVLGCFVTGVVGIIQALDAHEPIGVGIRLLASAFAFGIVVWASFK